MGFNLYCLVIGFSVGVVFGWVGAIIILMPLYDFKEAEFKRKQKNKAPRGTNN